MKDLSQSQLKFISDVLADLGQIFFASMVLPFFMANFKIEFLFSGLLLSFASWFSGLFLIKKVE